MQSEEQYLIRQLQSGDEKSFNKLFTQYHARIFNLCRKFLPLKEDAEEIVQIVFIAVWENRLQIDENKSFGGYVYAIARHWIYNTLKKRLYQQGYIDYLSKRGTYDFVTEDEVLFNELNMHLERLIADLPPRRREIFLLSHKEGLSYKAIAQQLSITESTVNTQLTKAVEYIRNNIKVLY